MGIFQLKCTEDMTMEAGVCCTIEKNNVLSSTTSLILF